MKKRLFSITIPLLALVLLAATALAGCDGGGSSSGASGASGGSSGEAASGGAATGAATASLAKEVQELIGVDAVYWTTPEPAHYHLFADCSELAASLGEATPQSGTTAQAAGAAPGASLCLLCMSRALSTQGLPGNLAVEGKSTIATKPAEGVTAPDVYYQDGYRATVSSDEGLRLRKGPSTESEIVSVLSKGDKMDVLGISNEVADWVYVRYDIYEGWVAAQYLTFEGTGTLVDTD
ncbi:MAG: SH3 domain-containing protein [Clostridiales Family XIII bacterium]|nr:SH3 domain-containing protein [Clostridiales Family XIII bacterium]